MVMSAKRALARLISHIPIRMVHRKAKKYLLYNPTDCPYSGEESALPTLHGLSATVDDLKTLLTVLTPSTVVGFPKARIGGPGDGGYVMLDPGHDGGIAYSFGISSHSPWDMEMAERGFKVYQFDGTIENAPNAHPNLIFDRSNIYSPSKRIAGGKCIAQILDELNHNNAQDIILLAMQGTRADSPRQKGRQKHQVLLPGLTRSEREIILAGCLINYYARK